MKHPIRQDVKLVSEKYISCFSQIIKEIMYKKPEKHHYETSRSANAIAVIIAIAVFALIMSYFVVLRNLPFNLAFTNRTFAISSVFLIGLSFILGPLARFLPKIFVPMLEYRKPLGLLGYGFAIVHVIMSLLIVESEVYAESRLSLVAGMLALLIFSFVAFSSMTRSIKAFGFERWQQIQRSGYLAYALVIVHFSILEGGEFIGRQLGQVTLVFALLVLALRVIVLFMKHPKK